MNQILVFGAGRSSLFLIEYLADYCEKNTCMLHVCDKDVSYAQLHFRASESIIYQTLDINDVELIASLIKASRLVVSLLPAHLHIHIAKICLEHRKHLATASYISDEMKALHNEASEKDLIFLNEMGLDPGIDHMSAMQMMDDIKNKGGIITGFKSFTGGLVADENDGDNPWKYKFTWNPRNVILAAQGPPAIYLEQGQVKLMPYHKIFNSAEQFDIDGYGKLEGYPNRDSLKYIELYGLKDVKDMIRGTFRKIGFCSAWQIFVDLGLTDNQLILNLDSSTTMKQWLASYLPGNTENLKPDIKKYCHCSDADIEKLEWLGFFTDAYLPIHHGSSADILEEILKPKWKLENSDKDLIVMLHQITYTKNGQIKTHQATMILKGESNSRTAMAKTVGYPLAMGCRLILENKIQARGVMAPLTKEIYSSVLKELEEIGISFN